MSSFGVMRGLWQAYNKVGDAVYKCATTLETKFEDSWKDVEKELGRLAEERRTIIANSQSNPESDPKAWLKAVDEAASTKEGSAARASTPPPPPPPNAKPVCNIFLFCPRNLCF